MVKSINKKQQNFIFSEIEYSLDNLSENIELNPT